MTDLNQLNYTLMIMQKSLLIKQQVLDSFSPTSEVFYFYPPADRTVYMIRNLSLTGGGQLPA